MGKETKSKLDSIKFNLNIQKLNKIQMTKILGGTRKNKPNLGFNDIVPQ